MGFQLKFTVMLCTRLTADGLRTTGARTLRSPLPRFATNLWLVVHHQPLEGATWISLNLDISAIFQDIIAIFLPYVRSLRGLEIPQGNLASAPVWRSALKTEIFFDLFVIFIANCDFSQVQLQRSGRRLLTFLAITFVVAVHSHPLEGTTRIFLNLDISATF